jgi:hypothetical protein
MDSASRDTAKWIYPAMTSKKLRKPKTPSTTSGAKNINDNT